MVILENIAGNLCDAYKMLQQGSMLHSDQLTTERRTNPDLKNSSFYTADFNLYFFDNGRSKEVLWGIAREPQNLILQNLDEALHQLKDGNYLPQPREASDVFLHDDTAAIPIRRLKLLKYNEEFGYFRIYSKDTRKLNHHQKSVARRIFGPDEDNFEKNMEMFAKEKMSPKIYVPLPDYIQEVLREGCKTYLARSSWLHFFYGDSHFDAGFCGIDFIGHVRGIRRDVSISEQEALLDRTLKNKRPSPESFDQPKIIHDQKGLEWARKLLDGTASGTVLDY